MTGIELLHRIGDVDPDLVREAELALARKGGKVFRRRIVAAIAAACLILLSGVGVLFGFLSKNNVPVPSGCLMVGSPINFHSPDYFSNINEHSIVKALDAWSNGEADGDPTIRITGNTTMRFGIEFVVTFDAAIAPGIPEEERALIASFIGWLQSTDIALHYECFQPAFFKKEVLDWIERIGCTYEELLENGNRVFGTALPFDTAVLSFRVMGYNADESDPEVQNQRSTLERMLEEVGLDAEKIERFLIFTLADEPVATYDGVFRTDPTDPEIPDRSTRYLYQYDGVWYFDNRACSESLLEMAKPNRIDYFLKTKEKEGDVVWVNGSYCRVTTDSESYVLHVNDPSMLAEISAGDRIGFAFYSEFAVEDCTLLIEERDLVTVANASLIEKR